MAKLPDPPVEPFTRYPLWLVGSTKLSPAAKTLLLILDDHRRRTGQCNPRLDTLSRETAVSTPTVKRALAELLNSGIVSAAKGQRTNSYRIAPRSDWQSILRDQIDPAENPAGSKRSGARDQIDLSEPAVSLLTEPEFSKQNKDTLSRSRKSTSQPGISPAKKPLAASVGLVVQGSLIEPEPTALVISEAQPQSETFEVWFEQKFWPHYPRKTAKDTALKAARRVAGKSPEVRDAILVGLYRQLPELESREPQFRPHASTWINGRRWADPPEAPRRPAESQREKNFRIAAEMYLKGRPVQ